MSNWDKLMDPARKALETLIAEGDAMADRIEELEAKLAKAVEALDFYGDERNYEGEYIADDCNCCGSWYEPKIHKDGQDSGDKARATLAELTGGKDDM